MRNYIILNNNNSDEITGLLIQSLPPISKPKIRFNVEEIDGRDGDIITKLGYSAYDKEITIGLYGDYDVDDVIAYFTNNQSGQVTFSNEPDKYYNYEIVDQIDFERLIRYKTATVTLHCQPFKYSTSEEKIQINATEVSGAGSNITLNNTENGASFTTLQINGDTSQNGTPTPTSPIDVNVVTGDNTINITGSQLLSINDVSSTTTNGITYSVQDNIVTMNGTSTGTTYIGLFLNNTISSGKTISYSANNPVANSRVSVRPAYNNSALETMWLTEQNKIRTNYTLSSDMNKIYVVIENNETLSNFVVKLMANVGTTALPYEPYQSQSYPINFGSLELCKIGNYQDYIYKDNGNWYKYAQIDKIVLNGSENWQDRPNYTYADRFVIDAFLPTINKTMLSNYFPNSRTLEDTYPYMNNNGTQFIINYSGKGTTTLAQFKTWLSSTKPVVYCILSTPTITQITDTTLINQLDALMGATTYLGQTNIITDGSDLDPLLEVETYAIENPSFTITNSGNIYSKPIITIYGIGTIGLYLNGIQVLTLNMGETTNQATIDVANLEAYNQETGALMNRSIIGDYNNLCLQTGTNTITESGTLQGIEIENYSRWL